MHQTQRQSKRSRMAVATVETPVRCAVYTRKSTDEGLDRDFTTLDNQRERAETFITSHADEGWVVIADRYDDGGYSGGNTDRPGLKRLLKDVRDGLVDCVVVYKYDRLGRSMIDCLKIIQMLDNLGVRFISITQQIDTSTSHGRMFLNNLLAHAQYERDVISERTRDKMRAARRHGKWTGGMPPLGYIVLPDSKGLTPNKGEADQVIATFIQYLNNPSLNEVSQELNRRGWRRKSWITKTGKFRQGGEWDRKTLRDLLRNPLYIGLQKLGDETFPGEHQGIVSKTLFNKVQKLLDANFRNGGATARNRYGALLRGILRCGACDSAMVHSPVKKGVKLYRYYRCASSNRKGANTCPTKQIRADRVEAFVVDQIRHIGADPKLQEQTFQQAIAHQKAEVRGLKAESKRLKRDIRKSQAKVSKLVDAITDTDGHARIAINVKLEEMQSHIETMAKRAEEIRAELSRQEDKTISSVDLSRTMEAFDPIWDVLLIPEKERVLSLLIDRVTYDGGTQEMKIDFKLAGIAELAEELDDAS